jgi:hypothetical protein
LLADYEIEREVYWVKDEQNRWILSGKDMALSFKASMGSWDVLKNVSALGCFVLKKL